MKVFDKYEVVRRIAVGGMGEIFLAKQADLVGFDRFVILKSLLPGIAKGHDAVQWFLDEARVVSKLNHPNIVSVFEVGLWENTYYIAMEYIRGVSLSELLEHVSEHGVKIPLGIVCAVVRDVAKGLHHAHTAKDINGTALSVVHRDVSPHNVMVRYDGVVKVVDFGIARATNRTVRTETGLIKGKLPYMAPEQVRGGELDHRSDQFSLGVVLWELCAVKRLFDGSSPIEILANRENRLARLDDTLEDLPVELAHVIERMLSSDRHRRFESCADVAAALSTFSSGVEPQDVADFLAAQAPQRPEETSDIAEDQDNFVIDLASEPTVSQAPIRSRFRVLVMVLLLATTVGFSVLWTARVPDSPRAPRVEAAVNPPSPPALASLSVVTEPPGARVIVTVDDDERVLGVTPLLVPDLNAGEPHVFFLERPGFVRDRLEVRLTPGEAALRNVTLEKQHRRESGRRRALKASSPPKSEPETGRVTLSSTPWTQVSLDGTPLGATPIFRRSLPVGEHTLRFTNPREGIDVRRKIRVVAGKPNKFNFDLR